MRSIFNADKSSAKTSPFAFLLPIARRHHSCRNTAVKHTSLEAEIPEPLIHAIWIVAPVGQNASRFGQSVKRNKEQERWPAPIRRIGCCYIQGLDRCFFSLSCMFSLYRPCRVHGSNSQCTSSTRAASPLRFLGYRPACRQQIAGSPPQLTHSRRCRTRSGGWRQRQTPGLGTRPA